MKSLIVYYSYEGNCEEISKAIKEVTDADVVCLKPKKEKKTKSLFRFVWGGMQVYMAKTPEIEKVDIDFSNYDLIFIGTPCWFGTFAPPLNTFFKEYKFENKQVAIFTCNGGNLRHTHKDLEEALNKNTIVDTIDFVYPIKNGIEKSQEKAKEWAKNCMKKANKKIE